MCASLEQQHISFDSLVHLDWHTCLPSWLGMGMVYPAWLYSMWLEIFLQMKYMILQSCSTKVLFNLGSLLHIISSLFSHFIQLNRKIRALFFIFPNLYVSWIERDKILISQLSPKKFGYFADQNWPKAVPMKMILTIFKCKNEVPKQLGLKKQMKKLAC